MNPLLFTRCQAKVRFDGEGSAKEAMEKAQEGEKKAKINDTEVTLTIMEGMEGSREFGHLNGLVQERRNSSALAMELCVSNGVTSFLH